MQTNILDFKANLPKIIYLDASFIINLCVKNAKFNIECKTFMQRLTRNKVICLISTLTIDEVWYGLIRADLYRVYKSEWLNEVRKTPLIVKNHLEPAKKATSSLIKLENVLWVEITISNTFEALELMERYSLFPRDAIHISKLKSLQVMDVVTTDPDWKRVEGINIYTCNPSLLKL